MKDVLAIVVGLGALGYGIYRWFFVNDASAGTHHMWWAIGCGVVFFICALIYFLGHVNKEEEIHITQ